MAGRLDPDLFYDRRIVGVVEAEEVEGGAWSTVDRLDADEFHRGPGVLGRGDLAAQLGRIAASPLRMAGWMLLFGFFAVFVNQASLVYQVVLGAPIFEEFLKFGLALVIAYPLRLAVLRLPVAWAVGAGFGWLEHVVTYADESQASFIWRVLFHGGATMLSMATFHVLSTATEVRARWLSTLPATLIHYVNNTFAILSIGLLPLGEAVVDSVGLAVSSVMVVACYVATLGVLVAASRVRSGLGRGARRIMQGSTQAL